MKVKEFLSLNSEQQIHWIERNIEEYEVLLYSDGYIGCSYPSEQIDLEQYENYPLDYDISGMIKAHLDGITPTRIDQIDNGAKLTKHEREALAHAVADEDMEGWLGHHGFQIDLDDGSVFTSFVSHSLGQGGASFDFIGIYASKEEMIDAVKESLFFALA